MSSIALFLPSAVSSYSFVFIYLYCFSVLHVSYTKFNNFLASFPPPTTFVGNIIVCCAGDVTFI